MEITEFRCLLENGLGGAILFLREHDSTPYQDVILDACLHNLALDRQIEGSRATYMFDVIQTTGQADFYRHQILSVARAISPDTVDYDTHQIFDLVGHWAMEGDEGAHEMLYTQFNDHSANEDIIAYAAGMNIIESDGIRGFLHVAAQQGALILADNTFEVEDYFLTSIKENVSEEAVAVALQQADDPRVAAYMKAAFDIQAKRKASRRRNRPDPSSLTYEQIKRLVQQDTSHRLLAKWGTQASAEELRRAADDLQAERDPEKLRRYMAIYYEAKFPLALDLLFSLAQDEDEWTASVAVNVLENIQDPSVRAFALECIERGDRIGDMVGLLAKNYQEGDWQLIERLAQRDLDREDYHLLELNVEHRVYELHPSPQAINVLLTLYNKGPCAMCRHGVIENLESLNALPDWMIEECRYDSNSDIREMFSENSVN